MMDGRVFCGEWDNNMMIKGKMSYLLADGTRTIKHETFDFKTDFKNELDPFDQQPLESVVEQKDIANEEYDKGLLTYPKIRVEWHSK